MARVTFGKCSQQQNSRQKGGACMALAEATEEKESMKRISMDIAKIGEERRTDDPG